MENDSKFGRDMRANLLLKSGEEDGFGAGWLTGNFYMSI